MDILRNSIEIYGKAILIIQLLFGIMLFVVVYLLFVKKGSESKEDKKYNNKIFLRKISHDTKLYETHKGEYYGSEKGNLRLLTEQSENMDNTIVFGIFLFLTTAGLFLILSALSEFFPNNEILSHSFMIMLPLFFSLFGGFMINDGVLGLRMTLAPEEKDLVKNITGNVILIEHKTLRGKEYYRIYIEYSPNGTVKYIHHDTHKYTKKLCPNIGDTIKLRFSPTLLKAISSEERHDCIGRITLGGILVFLSICVLLVFIFL